MINLTTSLNTGEVYIERTTLAIPRDIKEDLGVMSANFKFIPNGKAITPSDLCTIAALIKEFEEEKNNEKV